MIKEMNGWKVVRLNYENCYDKNGNLHLRTNRTSAGSIWNNNGIEYPLNEIVKPTLKDSLLFFFPNKEDADRFSGLFYRSDSKLVPCVAYNCRKINKLCYTGFTTAHIPLFWKLRKQKKYIKYLSTRAPKGTWGAESIKCLE
jgi:hypothetical protein